MDELAKLLVDGFAESHADERDQTLTEEPENTAELENLCGRSRIGRGE